MLGNEIVRLGAIVPNGGELTLFANPIKVSER
jgi:hypothetical protein